MKKVSERGLTTFVVNDTVGTPPGVVDRRGVARLVSTSHLHMVPVPNTGPSGTVGRLRRRNGRSPEKAAREAGTSLDSAAESGRTRVFTPLGVAVHVIANTPVGWL